MRLLPLILVIAAACSKSKPQNSRFIVDIAATANVTVTVAGRPIPLAPKDLSPGWSTGMVDFKESEVPSKTVPDVTVKTPCGPKKVTVTAENIRPPNDHNVVILTLERSQLPKPTTFIFAPGIEAPVTIGEITVSAPHPRKLDLYEAGCGPPIKVGTEQATLEPTANVIVVAPSSSKCLRSGVALYGNAAQGCYPESSETLTGKLVYPLKEVPIRMWEPLEDSAQSSSGCTNISWLRDC